MQLCLFLDPPWLSESSYIVFILGLLESCEFAIIRDVRYTCEITIEEKKKKVTFRTNTFT